MNAASARQVVQRVREAASTERADWLEHEARNFARTRGAPTAQATDEGFVERWAERDGINAREYFDRTREESGWRSHANPTTQWCGTSVRLVGGNVGIYRPQDRGNERE